MGTQVLNQKSHEMGCFRSYLSKPTACGLAPINQSVLRGDENIKDTGVTYDILTPLESSDVLGAKFLMARERLQLSKRQEMKTSHPTLPKIASSSMP